MFARDPVDVNQIVDPLVDVSVITAMSTVIIAAHAQGILLFIYVILKLCHD